MARRKELQDGRRRTREEEVRHGTAVHKHDDGGAKGNFGLGTHAVVVVLEVDVLKAPALVVLGYLARDARGQLGVVGEHAPLGVAPPRPKADHALGPRRLRVRREDAAALQDAPANVAQGLCAILALDERRRVQVRVAADDHGAAAPRQRRRRIGLAEERLEELQRPRRHAAGPRARDGALAVEKQRRHPPRAVALQYVGR
mmetsp:Transcript_8752/g.28813  ORF Transcript_8752/g.28813 Transcript_8752/m.28813 type:complete len:201 (-) Transcript_8752:568-1170(-)